VTDKAMGMAVSGKLNKLIMRLIIAAAKHDEKKVLSIAQEIVKLFEEGLEEEESEINVKSKS